MKLITTKFSSTVPSWRIRDYSLSRVTAAAVSVLQRWHTLQGRRTQVRPARLVLPEFFQKQGFPPSLVQFHLVQSLVMLRFKIILNSMNFFVQYSFSLFFLQKFTLKFIYSEKVTKFCEISTLLLSYVVLVKSKVEISQNFVAFSEYMNFTYLVLIN